MRNRDVTVNKGRFNQNQLSSSQHNTKKKNEKQNDPIVYKECEIKQKKNEVKQPVEMDVEKTVSTFNLQTELSKLKISIPFNELLENREYRDKLTDMAGVRKHFSQIIMLSMLLIPT